MSDIERQTGLGQPQAVPEDKPPRHITKLWIFPVDLDFMKSYCGILQLTIAVLSLIALISCSAGEKGECDYGGSSFFDFISGSTMLTMLLWWLFWVVTLTERFTVVPWRLGELIILGSFGSMYVIGDILIAARSCNSAQKVASAFGFFAFFGMCGHFFLSFQAWRQTEVQRPARSPQSSQDDNTKY